MSIESIKKLVNEKREAKEGEMYCAVEGCGRVDETHTAHCLKHGRSVHKIKKDGSTAK